MCVIGDGGDSGSNTTSTPIIPQWLKNLEKNTGVNWENAQGQLPSISQLYNNTPLEGTAQLNPMQLSDINAIQNYGTGPNAYESAGYGTVSGALPTLGSAESMIGNSGNYLDAAQNQIGNAQNQINYMTNPNNSGQTASTQAAMNQFSQETLPTLENTAASAGLGNSGALLQSVSQGQNNALIPLLQQQVGNQENAIGQYGNLASLEAGLGGQNTSNASALGGLANTQAGIGSTQAGLGSTIFGQDQTSLANALQAAGLPYSVAQQEATNLYNQQEQQNQFGQQIQLGPSSNFGIFGGNQSSTSISSPSKF